MSKYRTTKKNIKETENKIISVTYCGLQHLLSCENPFAYSTRSEGWACDYYEIPMEICISTGYSPIGKSVPYELIHKYDESAREICNQTYVWEERKQKLDALLADFARDVEREVFKAK